MQQRYRLPNSNLSAVSERGAELVFVSLLRAGVFVRVNEGGLTPRDGIFALQRRTSLSSEEKGRPKRLAYSADLRSVDSLGLVVPHDVYGMTPSQGVPNEAKNMTFIVVAHAH